MNEEQAVFEQLTLIKRLQDVEFHIIKELQ